MVISTNCFYVYQHVDPRTHLVRYIGKGKGKRAWNLISRSGHHKNWLKQLAAEGLIPEVTLLEVGKTEEQAFELEKLWIAACRSSFQPLTNLTDGGEGMSGWAPSEKTRRKMSENSGRPWLGKTFSEEHCQKLSEARKGENNPMFGRIGEKHPAFGKTFTKEHCRKISENNRRAMLGKPSPKRRTVIGTNLQTGESIAFESTCAAAAFIGGYQQHISACCRGEQKKTKGWSFKYLNTEGVKNAS